MLPTAPDPYARLPPQARLLVRSLGELPAFRLLESVGGTRLRVPVAADVGHWLDVLLGRDAFEQLVAEWGGQVLELPKYDSVLRELRHALVRELRAGGMTHDDVAQATGYSRRYAIRIAQADEPNDRQQDLFEAATDAKRDTAGDQGREALPEPSNRL